MSQLGIWFVFVTATTLLCIVKPSAGRAFVGLFFCVMALAVNVSLAVTNPDAFVKLAEGSYGDGYRDLATLIVETNPRWFGIATAAFQLGVGALILGRGRAVKVGLIAGIGFLLVITPLGMEELPNPILAGGMAFLLTKRFDGTVFDSFSTARTENEGRMRMRPTMKPPFDSRKRGIAK